MRGSSWSDTVGDEEHTMVEVTKVRVWGTNNVA
jgi:hypothetical protein